MKAYNITHKLRCIVAPPEIRSFTTHENRYIYFDLGRFGGKTVQLEKPFSDVVDLKKVELEQVKPHLNYYYNLGGFIDYKKCYDCVALTWKESLKSLVRKVLAEKGFLLDMSDDPTIADFDKFVGDDTFERRVLIII